MLQGKDWEQTASTHGRHVALLERTEGTQPDGRKCLRETYLWDLAGQPGYRLVNQLSLSDVALALVVFDAQSDDPDPIDQLQWGITGDQPY